MNLTDTPPYVSGPQPVGPMTVAEILRQKGTAVHTTTPEQPLQAAAVLMAAHRIGGLPVLEDHRIVGLLSETEVTRTLAERGAQALTVPIRAVMNRRFQTCTPESSLRDVMGMMTAGRLRHLPVLDDGRLCGIISIGDVVKHRLREMETETAVLRDALVARTPHPRVH